MKGSLKFLFLALAILLMISFASARDMTVCSTKTHVGGELICYLSNVRNNNAQGAEDSKLNQLEIDSFWTDAQVRNATVPITKITWIINNNIYIMPNQSVIFRRNAWGDTANIEWNIQILKQGANPAFLYGTTNNTLITFTNGVKDVLIDGANQQGQAVLNAAYSIDSGPNGGIIADIAGNFLVQSGGFVYNARSIVAAKNIQITGTTGTNQWTALLFVNNDSTSKTLQAGQDIIMNLLSQVYYFKGTINANGNNGTEGKISLTDCARIGLFTDDTAPNPQPITINSKKLLIKTTNDGTANPYHCWTGIWKAGGDITTNYLEMNGIAVTAFKHARIQDMGAAGTSWNLNVDTLEGMTNSGTVYIKNASDIINIAPSGAAGATVKVDAKKDLKIEVTVHGSTQAYGNIHNAGDITVGGNVNLLGNWGIGHIGYLKFKDQANTTFSVVGKMDVKEKFEMSGLTGQLNVQGGDLTIANGARIVGVNGSVNVSGNLKIQDSTSRWSYLHFKNGTVGNINVGVNLTMDGTAQIYYLKGTLNVAKDISLNNCSRINLSTDAGSAYEPAATGDKLDITAKSLSITDPNNNCWTAIRLAGSATTLSNVNLNKLYINGKNIQLLGGGAFPWGNINVTPDATNPTAYDGSCTFIGTVAGGGGDWYLIRGVNSINCQDLSMQKHNILYIKDNSTISGNLTLTDARILDIGHTTNDAKTFWVKGNTSMTNSRIHSTDQGQDTYKFDGSLTINGNRDTYSLENPDHVTVGGNLTMTNKADIVRMNQSNGTKGIIVNGNISMTNSRIHFNISGTVHAGGDLTISGSGYFPGNEEPFVCQAIYNPYRIEVGENFRAQSNGSPCNPKIFKFNENVDLGKRPSTGFFVTGKTSTAPNGETFISEYSVIYSDTYNSGGAFPLTVTNGNARFTGGYRTDWGQLQGEKSIRVENGSLTFERSPSRPSNRDYGFWLHSGGEIYAKDDITIVGLNVDGFENVGGVKGIESANGNITIRDSYLRSIVGPIKALNGKLTMSNNGITDDIIDDYSVTSLLAKEIELRNARVRDVTWDNTFETFSGLPSGGDPTKEYGTIYAKDKLTIDTVWFYNSWKKEVRSITVDGIANQDSFIMTNSRFEQGSGLNYPITVKNGNMKVTGGYSNYGFVNNGNIEISNGNLTIEDPALAKSRLIWAMTGSIHASGDILFKGVSIDGRDGGGYDGLTAISAIRTDNGNIDFENSYAKTIRGTISAPRNPTDPTRGVVKFAGAGITDDCLSNFSNVDIDANGFTVHSCLLYDITANESGFGGKIDVAGTISLTNAQITHINTANNSASRRVALIKAKNMIMDVSNIHHVSGIGKPANEPYTINIKQDLIMRNNSGIYALGAINVQPSFFPDIFVGGKLDLEQESKINNANSGSHILGNINVGKLIMQGAPGPLANQAQILVVTGNITVDNYINSKDGGIYFYGETGKQRKITVNSGDTTENNGKAIYVEGGLNWGGIAGANTDPSFVLSYQAPVAIYNNNYEATAVYKNTGIDSRYYGDYKAEVYSCDLTLENGVLKYDAGDPGFIINKKDTATLDGTLTAFNSSKVTIQKWDVCGAAPAQSCVSLTVNPNSYSDKDNGTSTATVTATLQGAFGSGATTKITCNGGETTETKTDVAVASGKATTTCSFKRDGSNHSVEARVNNSTVVCPQTFFSYGSGPGTGGGTGPVATILYISSYITDMTGSAISTGTVSITNLGLEAGEVCPTGPINFNISDGKAEGTINCDKLGVGKTRTATATITGSGVTDTIQITYKT